MDPYQTLCVRLEADSATIREAYLAAIRRHPPESDPEGFRVINEAYESIKTEDLRLMREIGAPGIPRSGCASPLEAAQIFFKTDLNPAPPGEKEFLNFLKS